MSVGIGRIEEHIKKETARVVDTASDYTESLKDIKTNAAEFVKLFGDSKRKIVDISAIVRSTGGCISLHKAFLTFSKSAHFKTPKAWLSDLDRSLSSGVQMIGSALVDVEFFSRVSSLLTTHNGCSITAISETLSADVAAVAVVLQHMERQGDIWRDDSYQGLLYFQV
jgi:hypothetical protein